MIHKEDAPEFIFYDDVKACYANIQHDWLIAHAPMNKQVLSKFLSAGIVFDGELFPSTGTGISEGSNLSPYLANFILDGMQMKVYETLHGTTSPLDYANSNLLRFADDVLVTVRTQEAAQIVRQCLTGFLAERGLAFSEEKTKILEFGRYAQRDRKRRGEKKPETFDFLGFTHYCSKGQKGQFRVKRKTSKKKFRAKVQEMKEWLRKRMHCKVSETIKLLNIKLVGYYRYYGITDNTNSIRSFYEITVKMYHKVLNRRSQKNRCGYLEYYEKIEKQIVKPKIYVDILKMSCNM